MRTRRFYCLITFVFCLLLFIFCLPASFAEDKNQRPKVGLALSGGGARGFAHVGVLKVLQEVDIPVDFIAGTSMGSVMGGLYALGYSPEELERLAININWQDAFNDNPPRKTLFFEQKKEASRYLLEFGFKGRKFQLPSGLSAGQKISNLLSLLTIPYTGMGNFDQMRIPYRAVATDIVTGSEVILDGSQLSLAESMRASLAIPVVFTPVDFGDKLLVDGGLVKNLPVDIVKAMGANIVIAVDVSTPLKKKKDLESLFAIIDQSISLQIAHSTEQQLALADMVITPNLENYTGSDFTKARELIQKGEEAAREKMEHLRELAESLKKSSTRSVLMIDSQGIGTMPKGEIKIDNVIIEGNVKTKELYLMKTLGIEKGEIVGLMQLENRIAKIFGVGFFDSVQFDITEGESGGEILKLKVKQREPNLFRFGYRYDDKDKGVGIVNLTLSRFGGRSSIFSTEAQFGGIFKAEASYFQYGPFGTGFFINPKVFYKDDFQFIYENQDQIGEFTDQAAGFEFGIGKAFKNLGEVTGRYQWRKVDFTIGVGGSDLPEFRENLAMVSFRSLTDTLDQFPFPNSGSSFNFTYDFADKVLGSAVHFHRVSLNYDKFFSPFRRSTFSLSTQLGTSLNTDLPTYEDYLFGGPDSFFGYPWEEFRGDHIAVARLGYRYKLLGLPIGLGKAAYVTFIFNAGNIWESLDDLKDNIELRYGGSLGFSLDTIVGPINVDFSAGDGGRQEVYFSAGFPF